MRILFFRVWVRPYGSGHPLQFLAMLRDFRFYPSHARNSAKFAFQTCIFLQLLKKNNLHLQGC